MDFELDTLHKPDRVVANSVNIDNLDSPIFRLFRADHLLKDFVNSTNTLVRPCFDTQGDENENPLREHAFLIGEDQRTAVLRDIMSDVYTQSWSFQRPLWDSFANGKDKLIIESTPRVLLSRLMDTGNRNYAFSYFIGRVDYYDQDTLDQITSATSLNDALLFNGHGAIRSVLRLFKSLEDEAEARLIFFRTADTLPEFDSRYPLDGDDLYLCAHPFDWTGVINSYIFYPCNRSTHEPLIREFKRFKQLQEANKTVEATPLRSVPHLRR